MFIFLRIFITELKLVALNTFHFKKRVGLDNYIVFMHVASKANIDNVLLFPRIKSLVVVAMLCALWPIDLILLVVAHSESGV